MYFVFDESRDVSSPNRIYDRVGHPCLCLCRNCRAYLVTVSSWASLGCEICLVSFALRRQSYGLICTSRDRDRVTWCEGWRNDTDLRPRHIPEPWRAKWYDLLLGSHITMFMKDQKLTRLRKKESPTSDKAQFPADGRLSLLPFLLSLELSHTFAYIAYVTSYNVYDSTPFTIFETVHSEYALFIIHDDDGCPQSLSQCDRHRVIHCTIALSEARITVTTCLIQQILW
jgi:hypothetical protein